MQLLQGELKLPSKPRTPRSFKTNQEGINHYLKAAGNDWDKAAGMARMEGVSFQALLKNKKEVFDPSQHEGVDLSSEVRSALEKTARAIGVKPHELDTIIQVESGWDPSKTTLDRGDSAKGAYGLLQWRQATAEYLFTSAAFYKQHPEFKEQFSGMNGKQICERITTLTAEQQMPLVEYYFKAESAARDGSIRNITDLYMLVHYPVGFENINDARSSSPSADTGELVLYSNSSDTTEGKRRAYHRNSGLDRDKDGKVTVDEAAKKVVSLSKLHRARWSTD
jgi:hypothetical protein